MKPFEIMQDKAVSSKYKLLSFGALVAGSALFGCGQLVGNVAQAHPPQAHAAPQTTERTDPNTRVLDMSSLSNMDGLIEKIADRRVVFVGETHDRYDHHLNQLAIIKGLYGPNTDLAIGLEFFQQPFQEYLDRYVAREIDERELLTKSEYFDRWRYDYRLYRPILRFAREKGIPLIALNVPRELTERVASKGFEGLDETDRAQVPKEIDRNDPQYRKRIEEVFAHHPRSEEKNFEHFLDAQLLWDEGMAERAADYLRQNPEKRMVVLAGSGHLMYGQGIPGRLLRRNPVSSAIVINSAQYGMAPGLADYLLFPERIDLPRSGLLGILLDLEGNGVAVKGFSEDSPAESVGLKKGDRVVTIAGKPVASYTDIRLSLMDHRAGEEVRVEVLRANLILDDERLSYQVKLY